MALFLPRSSFHDYLKTTRQPVISDLPAPSPANIRLLMIKSGAGRHLHVVFRQSPRTKVHKNAVIKDNLAKRDGEQR
ncbi:hypothetical protein BFR47_02295 [Oceanisphaera psychrotolerans]|uniref:Uncharacterized protein n=1 Tax=Oceanisphaera psychrotolerans TaxID=1414654 RepID=A0A1J4QDJ1_9GAMM|nr:hypothetical protein BFR47_02295 [Oceanisphaera psychrotolerans]